MFLEEQIPVKITWWKVEWSACQVKHIKTAYSCLSEHELKNINLLELRNLDYGKVRYLFNELALTLNN